MVVEFLLKNLLTILCGKAHNRDAKFKNCAHKSSTVYGEHSVSKASHRPNLYYLTSWEELRENHATAIANCWEQNIIFTYFDMKTPLRILLICLHIKLILSLLIGHYDAFSKDGAILDSRKHIYSNLSSVHFCKKYSFLGISFAAKHLIVLTKIDLTREICSFYDLAFSVMPTFVS